MDLFLEPKLSFEKVAAGTTMPEDPNGWPQEIIQELYKQVPYITDFTPHVTMQNVDGERGYAIGFITVMNQSEVQQVAPEAERAAAGVRQARIPFIVKEGKLLPLDILIADDAKVFPLTESRLRAAIFRPQAFDVTSKMPGDQSMVGQLYPPYRQNYGGGGLVSPAGEMGKGSSALVEYLTKKADFEDEHGTGGPPLAERPGVAKGMMPGTEGYHSKQMQQALSEKQPGPMKAKTGSALEKEAVSERFVRTLARTGAEKAPTSRIAKFVQKMQRVSERAGEKMQTGLPDDPTHAGKMWRKAEAARGGALEGYSKTGSILQAILPTMNISDLESFKETIGDQDVRLAYEKNAAATVDAVRLLLEYEPDKEKFARALDHYVQPTVLQLVRMDEGYKLKTANHKFWAPEERRLTRGEAIQELGSKVVLAADVSGAATVAEGAEAQAPTPDADLGNLEPASAAGLYRVQTEDGQELVGYVIPNLIDVDGTEKPLALFTNGSQAAIQGDIIGIPVEGQAAQLPTADMPQGHGVFFTSEGGELKATIPFTIRSSVAGAEGEPPVFQAETYDGNPVEISVQSGIQTVTPTPEGRVLVPEHWDWSPLDRAGEVSLASAEPDVNKQASARRKLASVEVVSGGETFSVRGLAVEKLASADREFLNLNDAMFLLAALGTEQGYGMRKLAEATANRAPVEVRIGRFVKTAEEQKRAAMDLAGEQLQRLPAFRRILFKEAAVITDPAAVDTVLSLGFINPENITTFIGYLPDLDGAQSKLCELLMASRLGLSDVPEGALEKSIRALEEVLEGLKTLAFQGPAASN